MEDTFAVIDESQGKFNDETRQTDRNEKLTRLPLTRVKNIIKLDPDVNLASQEAVFLIAKATVSSDISTKWSAFEIR